VTVSGGCGSIRKRRQTPAHIVMDLLARRLEALLFISPRPVTTTELVGATGAGEDAVAAALARLGDEYRSGRHGFELLEVAGGVTFTVAEDCAEAVRSHTGAQRPDELTPALLETLTVVAYLQPATRADVADVRGVSSEWALAALIERGLVEECGRAATPGAPILYRTTHRFLMLFGLSGLDALPPLEGFALAQGDVDALRERLTANAERRRG
jgi:segregation and condensation protein B